MAQMTPEQVQAFYAEIIRDGDKHFIALMEAFQPQVPQLQALFASGLFLASARFLVKRRDKGTEEEAIDMLHKMVTVAAKEEDDVLEQP